MRFQRVPVVCAVLALVPLFGCGKKEETAAPAAKAEPAWEKENPVRPIPKPPLGITSTFAELKEPPTPERVRLGRWLFFEKRLSSDGTISCASCHRPENAFSEPTPVSTGVKGQKGKRKAPSFVNLAWTIYPNFFWDGRTASLEDQAKGPVANPIEMGNTHEVMIATLKGISGYAPYFKQAFGTEEITVDRVAKAIADYERTRMSGNSPWDRWKGGDQKAVSDVVKTGSELFFGKALCNQCHLGQNFTDNTFHNLGIGWDAKTKTFSDQGRFDFTKKEEDRGAFKTPGLREVSKHAPYMHDGSMATLKEVMLHYRKGGNTNPHLDGKMQALDLTDAEIDALVEMMKALDGAGYEDVAPTSFPM